MKNEGYIKREFWPGSDLEIQLTSPNACASGQRRRIIIESNSDGSNTDERADATPSVISTRQSAQKATTTALNVIKGLREGKQTTPLRKLRERQIGRMGS